MKSVQRIVLAASLMVLGWVGMAAADTLSVTINNYYGETIQVEFYSQWYNRAWPGGDQAYDIESSREFQLACEPGEEIAFGAWVKYDPDVYWGVGDGHQGCERCVLTCGGAYGEDLYPDTDYYGD